MDCPRRRDWKFRLCCWIVPYSSEPSGVLERLLVSVRAPVRVGNDSSGKQRLGRVVPNRDRRMGLAAFDRDDPIWSFRFLGGMTGVIFLFISLCPFIFWVWGSSVQVSPRYLVVMTPLLALLAAYGFRASC